MTKIDDLSCKCSKLAASSWIIDSRESHHMTYNKTILKNIKTLPYPFLISLANRYKVKVTGIEDDCLNPTLTRCKVFLYLASSIT